MRLVAALASTMLIATGLVVGIATSPAQAAPPLGLTAKLDPSVLAGDPAKVTLDATNAGSVDYFNASYRYELPQGVTYRPGTALGPNGVVLPDPKIIVATDTAPPGTHQILIFDNVADIPAGLTATVAFTLDSTLPVGSTFEGAASVYTNTDPRFVAKFDASGTAVSGFDNSAIAPTTTSSVARIEAISVAKSEPSPEHELMRGIHSQQQTYTITTTNTTRGSTDSVVVVDYLPAGLEFLGCTGAPDNTTVSPEEYPGSGPLTTTAGGAGCVAPALVETINDRPGFAAGTVFTKVTWNIGTLAPGAVSTLTYAAGIPLRENVMFPTGSTPPAASGAQGSNLDNNAGPSTRQVAGGQSLTNTVTASGAYQGPVANAADRATSATDSLTVKAMDLSIVKGVADPNFSTNGTKHFTLLVRSSEYTADSAITIVDTIPDGLCPLVPGIVNNSGSALPAGCVTATSTVTNATITAPTTANSDGTFTLTLTPSPTSIPRDGSVTIGYDAFEGTAYRGNGQTAPVVAGDSFTNSVTIAGTTTDQTGVQTPTVEQATDDSSATLVSSGPSISKNVLPRPTPTPGTPVDCTTGVGYSHTLVPTYFLGDTVCFELTVTFATTTQTRNARVTDFVPVGTTYSGFQVAPGSTVTVTPVDGTQASTTNPGTLPAAWALGDTQGGTDRFVAKGSVLTLYVRATVTSTSSTGAVDIASNLMKYREASTNNTVLALRDQADYGIAPAPTVSLEKAVTAINGTPLATPSKDAAVKEGDVVTFSLDIANTGTATVGNDVDVDNLAVWDALPAAYTCAGWTVQVTGGSCLDPGDVGYPTNSSAPAGRSVIVWALPGAVAAGAHHAPVTYSVTVPPTVSVSSLFTNTASVVAFTSPNTAGGDTPFSPKGSLDPAHDTDGNTAPANDTADVRLASAVAAKSGATSITATNNNGPNQAVPGETIDYTYSVTVPAGTSVFNAVLKDTLPTGLKLPAPAVFSATRDGGALPPGVTLGSADGTLSFGSGYNNTTGADQVFSVVASGVIVDAGLVPGSAASITSITNTANFSSTTSLDPTSTTISQDKSYTVAVINPKPTLVKTVDKPLATGGDTVVFTLAAANTAGAPDAFNPVVVDCLPTGLTFVSSSPAQTLTGSCAGGSQYTWNLASPLPFTANGSSTITVTATVDPNSTGLARYTNTATVTTSSLAAGANDPTIESVQSASSSAAVTVRGASTVKSVTPTNPTVGDVVDYTVTVTVPPNEQFYAASIIDTLPVGITFNSGSDVVTCTPVGQCPSATRLNDGAVTASGQKIGWSLGDLAPLASTRTFTTTFTGTVDVATAGNTAGTVRTNQADLSWNNTAVAPTPTSADYSFQQTGDIGTAAVTVTEPRLSVAKSVSTATPAPGSTFTYTVTATNSSAANTSSAFGAIVTDVVPVGVIVDSGSLAGNATLTGNGPNGGGTITWSPIAPILPGASVVFTYSATLAPSSTLGTGALVNTADVPTYDSLATGGRNYNNVPASTATVTPSFPKLTLVKPQPNPSVAYRGQSFNWTIGATNTGTADAASVVLTDTLPANWTYDSNSAIVTIGGVSAGQIEPVLSGGGSTLTFTFGALPVGKAILIAYSATPGPTAVTGSTTLQTNTLRASATDATGATSNSVGQYSTDTKTATAHIDRADVTVVKSAGSPLLAGTTVPSAWTITMKNSGPDTAVGTSGTPFLITDTPATLPAGVTITAASGSGWACSTPLASGAFTCTRTGTLANGASFPAVSVSATIAADVPAGTSVTNTAAVSALTADPTASTDSNTAPVVVAADLAITKTINGTPRAGQAVSWTIGVSNLGPSVSTGPITVTDTLPAGLSGVTATGTGWSCPQASPLVCTRSGALAVGPASSITVTGTLAPSFTGTIDNSATVAGPANGNPANDTASTSTAVDTTTTLTIAKSLVAPITLPATTPEIVPGQDAVFQFVVTNTGTADARAVTIADALPDGLSYVAASATSTDPWTCTGSTTVACALTGTLAAGANTTLRITVTTPPTLTTGVTNTARVSSANAPDSQGSAVDPAAPRANFSITKAHPTGAVFAGNTVTFSLTAKNVGPSDSPGAIVVTDTLPAGLSATTGSISGSGWACVVNAQVITCSRSAALAAGATAPVILVVAAVAPDAGPATLVNSAGVVGPLPSTDTSSASTTDSVGVTDSSTVTIVKTATSGATVRAGENATYGLTVTNAGPSTADTLSVTDTLPAGMTAVSIAGTGWTCTLSSLTCVRPSLDPGATVITVVAKVASSVAEGTVLHNAAQVQWLENGAPRTASDGSDVTVRAVADLALAKVAVSPQVNAGDTAAFTLSVQNLGPSDAVGPLTVIDSLPAGLSYLSSSPEWSCTAVGTPPASQQLTCVLLGGAGLAAGMTASTLTVLTQVDASLPAGTLVNSAVVSSGTTDAIPANNTATADEIIGQSADLRIVKSHTGRGTIGDTTPFSLAVTNAGPSSATAVRVVDTLPKGVSYADSSGSDPAWTCVATPTDPIAGTSAVTCDLLSPLAPLAAAPTLIIRATVTAAAYPSVVNTAVVSSAIVDPNVVDNTSSDILPIDALVSLGVKKTHVGALRVGTNASYLIAVTNSGPTEDPGGFSIVDALPASLGYVDSSGMGVGCNASGSQPGGQRVVCTFVSPLAVGATRSVTLTVRVLPEAFPSVVNSATVLSLHPNISPESETLSTDVAPVAPALSSLSFTGAVVDVGLVLLFGLLILLGVALVLVGYRRRRNQG
jgi:uncharacterized repeat protein (TIGR01451 family)/fimbrial isopeptide formation D2 family protein